MAVDAKPYADRVFASLDGMPPAGLRLFAQALWLSRGVLSRFATAFDYYADAVEFPDVTGQLARLKLALDLRRAALFDAEPVLEAIEGAEAPPWPEIHAALIALRADREPIEGGRDER